jgi:hypothetical protein
MSGVGVGVTVGNAACTMAATVVSISTVGTAMGVGVGLTHPMANAKTTVSNITFMSSPWVQWIRI